MISPGCDLDEFLEAVRETGDYYEVIYLAEREATEAERLRLRRKAAERHEQGGCPRYAATLKGFIAYLRYGIQHPHVNREDMQVFSSLRDRLMEREFLEDDDEASAEC